MEAVQQPVPAAARPILAAELLSIGSEITTGATRDTNASELARSLAVRGVTIVRLSALPDELAAVGDAFATALGRADLVVSTGGLGPTPDDLTRESIAALCDEIPTVDAELERWLRALWARRGMPFPELNLKQAWIIPSAHAIPNPNGTAPGWWVERPDGRVIVALPGPPGEMRAMWADWVLPQLHDRGLGRAQTTRTYRLAGIGESQVAHLLGEGLLTTANPLVATYARADAVDVRISAVAEPSADGRPGRPADELVDEAEAVVLAALGQYVWGRDDETWPQAIGRRLEALGWTLATREVATGGTLAALLGGQPWLRLSESVASDDPGPARLATSAADPSVSGTPDSGALPSGASDQLERLAADVRKRGATTLGLVVRIAPRGDDTAVTLAIDGPGGPRTERRLAFLGGDQGRSRAALLAAAALLERLRAAVREVDGALHIGDDTALGNGRQRGENPR